MNDLAQQHIAPGAIRKTITGVHTGPLLGVAPTGRSISIAVIDIVRISNGRYAEHHQKKENPFRQSLHRKSIGLG